MATTLTALSNELNEAGYYPILVADMVEAALDGEELLDYFVHLETTFDSDEVRRHESVLSLTPTRLLLTHIDDQGPNDITLVTAAATTEAVPLRAITAVLLTCTVENPQAYSSGDLPIVVTLGVGWGAVRRIDLEPASCGDPDCEADHGLTGSSSADDVMLRISSHAEGPDAVRSIRRFAAKLSHAAGQR